MDTPASECGWVKLWHKRGVQVTIPLRGGIETFSAQVDGLFEQGYLAQAPGLEEGEEKETVGWVLKGIHSNEKQETPFVLLYSTNDALKWSFLKVYLNTEAEREAFEYASKMKLDDIPEYVGQDKPQRGTRSDRYIVAAPRPFGVVFKKNPKHDDTEAGKMKPARLFVRWAEQKPQAAVESDPFVTQAEIDELDKAVEAFELATGKTLSFVRFLAAFGGPECKVASQLRRSQWQNGINDLRSKIAKGGAK